MTDADSITELAPAEQVAEIATEVAVNAERAITDSEWPNRSPEEIERVAVDMQLEDQAPFDGVNLEYSALATALQASHDIEADSDAETWRELVPGLRRKALAIRESNRERFTNPAEN